MAAELRYKFVEEHFIPHIPKPHGDITKWSLFKAQKNANCLWGSVAHVVSPEPNECSVCHNPVKVPFTPCPNPKNCGTRICTDCVDQSEAHRDERLSARQCPRGCGEMLRKCDLCNSYLCFMAVHAVDPVTKKPDETSPPAWVELFHEWRCTDQTVVCQFCGTIMKYKAYSSHLLTSCSRVKCFNVSCTGIGSSHLAVCSYARVTLAAYRDAESTKENLLAAQATISELFNRVSFYERERNFQ